MANLSGTNGFNTSYGLNALGCGFSFKSAAPLYQTTVNNQLYYINAFKNNKTIGYGDLIFNYLCTNTNSIFASGDVFISEGSLTIQQNLTVHGNEVIQGNVTFQGNAEVEGSLTVDQNEEVKGNLQLTYGNPLQYSTVLSCDSATNQLDISTACQVAGNVILANAGNFVSIQSSSSTSNTLNILGNLWVQTLLTLTYNPSIVVNFEVLSNNLLLVDQGALFQGPLYLKKGSNQAELVCDVNGDQLNCINDFYVLGNCIFGSAFSNTASFNSVIKLIDNTNPNESANLSCDPGTQDVLLSAGLHASTTVKAPYLASLAGYSGTDPPNTPAINSDGFNELGTIYGPLHQTSDLQPSGYVLQVTDLQIDSVPYSGGDFGGGSLVCVGPSEFKSASTWICPTTSSYTIDMTGNGNTSSGTIEVDIATLKAFTIIGVSTINGQSPNGDAYTSPYTSVATNTLYSFSSGLGFTTIFPKIQVIFSDVNPPNLSTNANFLAGHYVWDISNDKTCYDLVWQDNSTFHYLTKSIVAQGVNNSGGIDTRTSGFLSIRLYY